MVNLSFMGYVMPKLKTNNLHTLEWLPVFPSNSITFYAIKYVQGTIYIKYVQGTIYIY